MATEKFDPYKFGAKKVESTAFDPTQFGAKRVDQATASLVQSERIAEMQRVAKQAKIEAEKANSAAGLAKETGKGIIKQGLNFIGSALKAPGDIIGGLMGKAPDQTPLPTGDKTIQARASDMAGEVFEGTKTPTSATLASVGDTAFGAVDVVGAGGLLKGGINLVKKPLAKVSEFLANRSAKKSDEKATKLAIEALNPDLKGKKLVDAYKQIGTKGRDVTPMGIRAEQKLAPDEQTIKLAERLKGVMTDKNPIKNLQSASKEFEKTESKINQLVDQPGDVVYNADKAGLSEKLNEIKASIPREFNAIKDSKKVHDDVVNFAQKKLMEIEDSSKGLRVGRTSFDFQAKKEFPSAYKEGTINTATPAGRAIKEVRDIWNEHFYGSFPEGSEVKQLILRENDLYRAIENIAPKAAKGEGKKALAKWAEENPKMAKTLEALGLLTLGGTAVGVIKSD